MIFAQFFVGHILHYSFILQCSREAILNRANIASQQAEVLIVKLGQAGLWTLRSVMFVPPVGALVDCARLNAGPVVSRK